MTITLSLGAPPCIAAATNHNLEVAPGQNTHTHNVAQKYPGINKDVTVLAVYSSIVGLKGIWKNFSFNSLKTVVLLLNNLFI